MSSIDKLIDVIERELERSAWQRTGDVVEGSESDARQSRQWNESLARIRAAIPARFLTARADRARKAKAAALRAEADKLDGDHADA